MDGPDWESQAAREGCEKSARRSGLSGLYAREKTHHSTLPVSSGASRDRSEGSSRISLMDDSRVSRDGREMAELAIQREGDMRATNLPGPWCRTWFVALGTCLLAGCPPKSQSQTVCVDCFDIDGYHLDLSAGSGANPPAAVLFSGWRNGRCQDDVVCTGTPDVFLGDVRWGAVEWSVDCNAEDQEIIAFSGGHQPFDATPRLAPGQNGKLSSTITPVAFAGPLQVNVK